MDIVDILNFVFGALSLCKPLFVLVIPMAVAFGFLCTVPYLIRYIIGVRK